MLKEANFTRSKLADFPSQNNSCGKYMIVN